MGAFRIESSTNSNCCAWKRNKKQIQIHDRMSRMYDDRYDGKIDEAFFQKKLKEYKDREFAIIQEMESHAKADESFHVTANMVLSLARRSRKIFKSSEVDEKHSC